MKLRTYLGGCVLAAAIGAALASAPARASDNASPQPGAAHDGAHDFDFNFGTWKTHIQRMLHPLDGSPDTLELTGTVNVRKVWGGRALLEEIEADGAHGHWQALTLFLYNPQSQQWSQSFSNSADGTFSGNLTGSFHGGRGELFAQDTFEGRSIFVRGIWSDVEPTSHRYEEDYSADGGKTWKPAFRATLTKEPQ